MADGDGATVGFVLAGGGFKGAFEVGAIAALVGDHGIVPEVITATSAGAVLGTVVAQGRTAEECLRYLGVARSDLLAMTRTETVFSEQPWLADLDGTSLAARIHSLVTDHGRPDVADEWEELEAQAAASMEQDTAGTADPAGGGEPDDLDDLDESDRDAGAGRAGRRSNRWRSHLPEELDVHPFERVSSLVQTVKGGHEHGVSRSVLTLDPFETSVRGGVDVGIATIDASLVARPGMQLRLAVTALKARETRYVTQDGVLVGPDARTPVPGAELDLIDGVIASASVPGVFPPREIGGEPYVDGGCLQNIPLQAAIDLGAQRVFTLVASPVRQTKRTLSLWAAESLGYLSTQAENLAVDLPDRVTNTVIEPTLEVVGSFEVHMGLMNIDIDYGHMRATEVLSDLDPGLEPIARVASDTVTRMRQLAWKLEDSTIEAGRADDAVLDRLRALKRSVRAALEARTSLGFPTPAGSDRWWQTWELHGSDLPDGFPSDLT